MRRALPLLLAGWLLGIVTAVVVAYAVPNLLYERRSVMIGDAIQLIRQDWIILRYTEPYYTLERPRLRLP